MELTSSAHETLRAYLSVCGISVGNLVKSYAQDQLKNPDSQVKVFLDEYIEKEASNEKLIRSMREKCIIRESLRSELKTRLLMEFPEVRIEFAAPRHFGSHSIARALRHICRVKMMTSMGFHKLEKRGFLVKDVGSYSAGVVLSGETNIHMCCPILSHRDAQRHSDSMLDIEMNLDQLEEGTRVRAETFIRQWSELNRNVGKRFDHSYMVCKNISQECSVQSKFCMFNHSSYDISVEDMVEVMEKAGSVRAKGAFIFDQELLMKDRGEIPDIECMFEKYDENGVKRIRFWFRDDVSIAYDHDWKKYISIFSKFSVRSKSGKYYYVQLNEHKFSHIFFTITKNMVRANVPKEIIQRPVCPPMGEDLVVLHYYDWDETAGVIEYEKMVPTRVIVPKRLYESVSAYVRNLPAGKTDISRAVTCASSYNTRIVQNGVEVQIPKSVPADIAQKLAHAVLFEVYVSRYKDSKVLQELQKDQNEIRDTRGLWESLKLKISRLKDPKPVKIYKDPILTDIEHPEAVKTEHSWWLPKVIFCMIRRFRELTKPESKYDYRVYDFVKVFDWNIVCEAAKLEASPLPDYHEYVEILEGPEGENHKEEEIKEKPKENVKKMKAPKPAPLFISDKCQEEETDFEMVNASSTSGTHEGVCCYDAVRIALLKKKPLDEFLKELREKGVNVDCQGDIDFLIWVHQKERVNICLHSELEDHPEGIMYTRIVSQQFSQWIHLFFRQDGNSGHYQAYVKKSKAEETLESLDEGTFENLKKKVYPDLKSSVCRSEYKLFEILEKHQIMEGTGKRALDLGAYPGGWSLLLKQLGYHVTSVIQPHQKIKQKHTFVVRSGIEAFEGKLGFDLVVSDAAPDDLDQLIQNNNKALVEFYKLVWNKIIQVSKGEEHFIMKMHLVDGIHEVLENMKVEFVHIERPKVVRKISREFYLYGRIGRTPIDSQNLLLKIKEMRDEGIIRYLKGETEYESEKLENQYESTVKEKEKEVENSKYERKFRICREEYVNYLEHSVDEREKQLAKTAETYKKHPLFRARAYKRIQIAIRQSPDNIALVRKEADGQLKALTDPKSLKPEYKYAYRYETKKIEGVEKMAKGEMGMVSDFTEFLTDKKILERVKLMSVGEKKVQYRFIQGVPGCGKTTWIVQNFKPGSSLVLVSTVNGRDDVIGRLKEEYGGEHNRNVQTYASILMNGPKQEGIEWVICDEAGMQHPGAIDFSIKMTQCHKVTVLGDGNQIAFIDRHHFNIVHGDLLEILKADEHLSVSWRVPQDIASYFSDQYPGGFMTRNKVRRSVNWVKIQSLKSLDWDHDVYLTFTQQEKTEVLIEGKGKKENIKVRTIHEYQGDQARSVAIVRNRDKDVNRIYESDEHILVALTRHTQKLVYYSASNDDKMKRIIKKMQTYTDDRLDKSFYHSTGAGEDLLKMRMYFQQENLPPQGQYTRHVINLMKTYSNLVVVESGTDQKVCRIGKKMRIQEATNIVLETRGKKSIPFEVLKKLPEKLIISVDKKNQSDEVEKMARRLRKMKKEVLLYDRDSSHKYVIDANAREAIDSVLDCSLLRDLPNARLEDLYDMEQVEPEENKSGLGSYTVESLQKYHDEIFPNCSYNITELDTTQVYLNDLEVYTENMTHTNHSEIMQEPEFDTVKSSLSTMAPIVRPLVKKESVIAYSKRNFMVPDGQFTVDSHKKAEEIMGAIRKYTYRKDYQKLLDYYQKHPVRTSDLEISQWLEDQETNIVNAIYSDKAFWEEGLDVYHAGLKRMPKANLTEDAWLKYPALQTIVFHPKRFNAVFCPIFKECKNRIRNLMAEETVFFSDMSPKELGELITRKRPCLNGMTGEGDISKFDVCQQLESALVDYYAMRDAGLDPFLALLWFWAHTVGICKDFKNKIRFMTSWQRKSGDAWTLPGNSCYMIGCVLRALEILQEKYKKIYKKKKAMDIKLARRFLLKHGEFMRADLRNLIKLMSGDDHYIFGIRFPEEINSVVKDLFNLDMKVFDYDSHYFCSKFVIRNPISLNWYALPDPVKLLVKLGRQDLRNQEHKMDFRNSLRDLVKEYVHLGNFGVLNSAISDRYNLKTPGLAQALYSVINDDGEFDRLFPIDPAANYTKDPSRPRE